MARRRRRRAHNQGCAYQRGLKNWWIKWREGGRARYSGGYESRELAEQVRTKIAGDVQAGRVGLPADPKGVLLLAELATDLPRRESLLYLSRCRKQVQLVTPWLQALPKGWSKYPQVTEIAFERP